MPKIYFEPMSKFTEEVLDPPLPAYKVVPEWYKTMSTHMQNSNGIYKNPQGLTNLTMKACAPVFDSITAGYVFTSPADIAFVDLKEYGYRAMWDVNLNLVDVHSSDQIVNMPFSEDFEEFPMKWNMQWKIKTDPGYSTLVVHPFYRFDLPFLTLPGIVDTDSYPIVFNLPFLLKKNFKGVLPMGTPIAQFIPIKRDSWTNKILPFVDKGYDDGDILRRVVFKSYKKRWWQKKSYR